MNFGFLTECYARADKSHAQAYADATEQVDAAEAMGLDSIWMVEQHFRPWASLLPSPMLFGSAIAARTKRVRIGMAVAVLPLCNPLRVAEESYMLDQISGGVSTWASAEAASPSSTTATTSRTRRAGTASTSL